MNIIGADDCVLEESIESDSAKVRDDTKNGASIVLGRFCISVKFARTGLHNFC